MIDTTISAELDLEKIMAALIGSLQYLEFNYKLLDNLNVFPVPDGDTGVNMLLTIKPSVENLTEQKLDSIDALFKKFNEDVTSNSRGNSGFILSRFINGFSKPIIANRIIDHRVIKDAFSSGVYEAKASLMNPVEGTMLTIMSAMSNCLQGANEKDVVCLLELAAAEAEEVLFDTPKMLPSLAKAGVVDSGALGFIFIIRGLLAGIGRQGLIQEDEQKYRFAPDSNIVDDSEMFSFKYCTEVIAENVTDLQIEAFKGFLNELGDSIAVLYENGLLKVHIHTNEPEIVIGRIGESGNIIKKKIEDMQQQVSVLKNPSVNEDSSILSIIPGDGFVDIFSGLGAEEFLIYDNLPSVKELVEKIDEIENEQILVLPNDKNIIPVALHAQKMTEKNIAVVLTRNVVQGISSLYGYNEFETLDKNIEAMNDNIDMAICVKVNISLMEVQYGNILIEKDDFFITRGDDVLSTGKSFSSVLLSSLKKFDMKEKANITFYYNDTMDIDLLKEAEQDLLEVYDDLDVDIQYGGQRKSAVIIAIE